MNYQYKDLLFVGTTLSDRIAAPDVIKLEINNIETTQI